MTGWTRVRVMAGRLAGCATLPVSGPTGAQVIHQAQMPGPQGFRLVEVGDGAALPVNSA